jgi:methyl-accepting chemotaxis protein
VVGQEVRSLVLRVAGVVTKIEALIDDSVGKIEVGAQLTQQAARL